MEFQQAYQKFRRIVKEVGKYNIDDVNTKEILQAVTNLATQMRIRVRKDDPRNWTVKELNKFTNTLGNFKGTLGPVEHLVTPKVTPRIRKFRSRSASARKAPRSPAQQKLVDKGLRRVLGMLQAQDPLAQPPERPGYQQEQEPLVGELPPVQPGKVGKKRRRELQHHLASRPINVTDTAAISIDRDDPETQQTPTPLPGLDEFASIDEGVSNLSQHEFGQRFGGGRSSLEDEVNPPSATRTQMASASGASMPQMNLRPHSDHQKAHQPRTDTFNRMQSNPQQNVHVMSVGSPFQAGAPLPPAREGTWAAPAPRLQTGGDDRTYDVTETTNNLVHPQSGIGGNAERDEIMRKKTIPINLSGVSDEAFAQGRAAEQQAKTRRDRQVAEAMMGGGGTVTGEDIEVFDSPAPTVTAPTEAVDAPRPPQRAAKTYEQSKKTFAGRDPQPYVAIPPGQGPPTEPPPTPPTEGGYQDPRRGYQLEEEPLVGELPEMQQGIVGKKRGKFLIAHLASRPITVHDTAAISIDRDDPSEQKTTTEVSLPPLEEGGESQLNPDLVEEYERLRKQQLRYDAEHKGEKISEKEQQEFETRLVAKELEQFREQGKEKGNESLIASILVTRTKMYKRDVPARVVAGHSSPLKPPPPLTEAIPDAPEGAGPITDEARQRVDY